MRRLNSFLLAERWDARSSVERQTATDAYGIVIIVGYREFDCLKSNNEWAIVVGPAAVQISRRWFISLPDDSITSRGVSVPL